MDFEHSTPAQLGYRMPAEWEAHAATWLSWPRREGISFPGAFDRVLPTLREMVTALVESEPVNINVCNGAHEAEARSALHDVDLAQITFHRIETNEPWCRDHGPIFLTRDQAPKLCVVDWDYNAWGNKYPPFDRDEVVPTRVAEVLGAPVFYPKMILEGGSIDVNGKGVCLTTESCLLNENRNPTLSRGEVEQRLRDFLGVREIVWLARGTEGDDTDGHIDNLARFVNETTVLAIVERDRNSPNYEPLQENLRRLRDVRIHPHRRANARAPLPRQGEADSVAAGEGRKIDIVELPTTRRVVREDIVLPMSHANFYIANTVVLAPQYGEPNDDVTLSILREHFPSRRVVGIDCRELIWGLGAFHCLTQQQPAV